MIGALPASKLAPPEYGRALDAAMTLIGVAKPVLALCGEPALEDEVRQRLPTWTSEPGAAAGLWVEPDQSGWRTDLARLAVGLAPGAHLALVISLPLARLLPARRVWIGRPLGVEPAGLATLRGALASAGLRPEQFHGFHGPSTIILRLAASLMERGRRPDLADRLGFAAQARYHATGPLARLCTVGLLLCRQGMGTREHRQHGDRG